MSTCTCIIPFYNEEKRILSVLWELLKIKEFDEIILVNDWSYDNWGNIVKKYIKNIKHVKIVEYPKNHGKSYAAKKWLSLVKTDYVFFFDADLQWVIPYVTSVIKERRSWICNKIFIQSPWNRYLNS